MCFETDVRKRHGSGLSAPVSWHRGGASARQWRPAEAVPRRSPRQADPRLPARASGRGPHGEVRQGDGVILRPGLAILDRRPGFGNQETENSVALLGRQSPGVNRIKLAALCLSSGVCTFHLVSNLLSRFRKRLPPRQPNRACSLPVRPSGMRWLIGDGHPAVSAPPGIAVTPAHGFGRERIATHPFDNSARNSRPSVGAPPGGCQAVGS